MLNRPYKTILSIALGASIVISAHGYAFAATDYPASESLEALLADRETPEDDAYDKNSLESVISDAKKQGAEYSPAYQNSVYYNRLKGVSLTGDQRKDMIAVAQSQVGYHEGNSEGELDGTSSGDGNYTEYGRYYGSNGRAWCTEFASWCARHAGIPTSILADSRSANPKNFKAPYHPWKDTVYAGGSYVPGPGDLALFAWSGTSTSAASLSHTSIVYSIRQNNDEVELVVIHGNYSNMVKKTTYRLNANDGTLDRGTLVYFVAPSYNSSPSQQTASTSTSNQQASNSSSNQQTSNSASDEQIKSFVRRLYKTVLGREPDTGGFNYWVNSLKSGAKTGADVVAEFYTSEEMKAKGLSNSKFMDLAYNGIMGRSPDPGGKKYWIDCLESGVSYDYVASGFIGSQEFTDLCASYGINRGSRTPREARDQNIGITKYVSRLYKKALCRDYDTGGLNYWCQRILNDTDRENVIDVAADGFFHSEEFIGRNYSNADYIRICYRTFLGREAEPSGFAYWKELLDSEARSRDDLIRDFAYSDEFNSIMASYGL